jgi:hypothetical protein
MTVVLPNWPDAELVMIDLLAPVPGEVVTFTPASFAAPLVRVLRVGGEDDGITDYPQVEVTCFGATRPAAWSMAEQCRQIILASGGEAPGGVLIDFARTDTPAQQLPDPNPDLRVVTATYRLGMRRPFTP